MGEMVAETKFLMVHMRCDKCRKGIMRSRNDIPLMTTYPPRYVHVCDNSNCENEEYYTTKYPYLVYLPIEQLRELREDEKELQYE